ncbi:unnamed protein product [Candidula unifasciata]|uniref:Uncharacterized protein n=1 Tax=Candidula unifasciata TaxID=100452 RepID=A0A8S3ZYH8_9EUPU|nr:unnamed protein product [Candidula unifasciata]
MIRAGDSTIHLQKVKPMQLAEIRSHLQKRPAGKISIGLSPEAREAMQQAAEESKIQDTGKPEKRGSKGNVLFKDTVQVRQQVAGASSDARRGSCSDIFEDAQLDSTYTSHLGALLDTTYEDDDELSSPRKSQGRRRSSVYRWIQKRESLAGNAESVDEVDEVSIANQMVNSS